MPRVLIVEDDIDISGLMTDVLRDEGFDVDTAENGAVAIAKVQNSPPDLITLDLMMPVMDGWEFMRRCVDTPACANRPLLVVSAITKPEVEWPGKCEFLAKPFELRELTEAVARMVP